MNLRAEMCRAASRPPFLLASPCFRKDVTPSRQYIWGFEDSSIVMRRYSEALLCSSKPPAERRDRDGEALAFPAKGGQSWRREGLTLIQDKLVVQ